MRIKNFTPHSIAIFNSDGSAQTIAPEPVSIRVHEFRSSIENNMPIPVDKISYGEVALPAPEEGTILIVSLLVLQAIASNGVHRADCYMPGLLVRNDAGQIIGCSSLAKLA